MSLTGQQFNRIQQTIVSAYDRDDLRCALKVCMNEDFDRLVADA